MLDITLLHTATKKLCVFDGIDKVGDKMEFTTIKKMKLIVLISFLFLFLLFSSNASSDEHYLRIKERISRLIDLGRHDEAVSAINHLLSQDVKSEYIPMMTDMMVYWSGVNIERKRFIEAQKILMDAERWLLKGNYSSDPSSMITVKMHLFRFYVDRGMKVEARKAYNQIKKSLMDYRIESHYQKYLFWLWTNVKLEQLESNVEKSEKYLKDIVSVSREAGDFKNEALANVQLSRLYNKTGKVKQSESTMALAVSTYKAKNESLNLAMALVEWAESQKKLQRYSQAKLNLQFALEIYKGLGQLQKEAETKLELIMLDIVSGKNINSADLLRRINEFELTTKTEHEKLNERLLEIKISLYEKMEDPEKQLINMVKLYALQLSMQKKAVERINAEQIAALNVRESALNYKVEVSLSNLNKINSEIIALERKNDELYYLIVSSLLIFFMTTGLIVWGGKHVIDNIEQHDVITKSLTQKAFLEYFKRSWEDVKGDYSLIMIQIVEMRRINVNFGYSVGNQVLNQVALNITESYPNISALGRCGVDSFIIALPYVDHDEVHKIAQKIIRDIRCYPWYRLHLKLSVTACMGISSINTHSKSTDDLLKQCHLSMLLDKKKKKSANNDFLDGFGSLAM